MPLSFAVPIKLYIAAARSPPAVGADEQIVLASERDTAQGILGKDVTDLRSTVLAVEREVY